MQAQGRIFALASDELAEGATVPLAHVYAGGGCGGGNRSPSLAWRHAPEGTKSFAVTVHDPDAPHPGGWWHWLLTDIPAGVSALSVGAGTPGHEPAGSRQDINSYGGMGYGGPCPPVGHGIHHYVFAVYALDTQRLDIRPDADPEEVAALIRRHALAEARLTAVYGR